MLKNVRNNIGVLPKIRMQEGGDIFMEFSLSALYMRHYQDI